MTATNLNNQIASPSTTTQISIATASTSSKNSISSKLYLGPGWTNVPGITNLYYAPHEFVQSAKAMVKAEQIHDREGIAVNRLRAASLYFSFINSLSQLAWYILKGVLYFKVLSDPLNNSLVPLSMYISGIGFIICAIEGILETHGLVKTKQFYSELNPFELESFKKALNDPILGQQKFYDLLSKFLKSSELPSEIKSEIETFLNQVYSNEEFNHQSSILFNKIEKNIYTTRLKKLQQIYLQISPENVHAIEASIKNKFPDLSLDKQEELKEKIIKENLKERQNDLIRRVHPWLAEEIQENVSEILQDLQSNPLKSQEAKEKAIEIFKNIKTQSMKKFLIHGIGLTAVLITFAGLILSCVACPFFVPLIILTIGGILAIARYYLDLGLMNSKGWEFKIKNCLPSFLIKKKPSRPEQKLSESVPFLTLDLNRCKQNSFPLESYPSASSKLDYTIAIPSYLVV